MYTITPFINEGKVKWPEYVDPTSGEKLVYKKDSQNKMLLKCLDTNREYEIINEIPRLLVNIENYAAAFGEQWLRWRKTQLDSYSSTTISRDRLFRCLGEQVLHRIRHCKEILNVLEVGCGAGRFTEILLSFPSVQLTSLDLSSAVEANALNFPQNERHRVVQADIMQPPFKPQQYDIVICLGVIQHTPNSDETIAKLYNQVKPGGHLIIDHYTFEFRRLTKITGNLMRPIVKRLPSERRMHVVEKMVDIFFPIHRSIRKIPYAQQIFSRISPINTYFHAYPQLSENLQRDWAVLDTHDGMTDWYKRLKSLKQISVALQRIGVSQIEVWSGGNGIEARGKRPL
jgi:2-polyprenyl-3-methyl-5-hydroxy-6-metoxy-1,4-benzoquinol methylase